ncbi:unnamed protein product [Lymnaea stagnalis]|uniref:Cyclic nucleotide-binding domain-containing protein n=1 Tax=Lymnaea stagnalis TaxID=6523 RepID=A0AAV2H2Y0_LYMST
MATVKPYQRTVTLPKLGITTRPGKITGDFLFGNSRVSLDNPLCERFRHDPPSHTTPWQSQGLQTSRSDSSPSVRTARFDVSGMHVGKDHFLVPGEHRHGHQGTHNLLGTGHKGYNKRFSRFKVLEDRFLHPVAAPSQHINSIISGSQAISRTPSPKEGSLASSSSWSLLSNEEPLVKFRRVVKMVLHLLRATYNSRERSQRRERYNLWASFLGSTWTTSKRAYEMYGISFDPQDFKANREIQVTVEAKAILSLEPSRRTHHQLRQVLLSLRQAVNEFSEFPITMQESLVRVGWYEHFEAKRVIIRQGHTADNFYFILSGTAVVIVLETDKQTGEQTARTAAFLGKGKSFGELALMHQSRRSATVTCRDDVELLAVGREDFIDIFMHVERDVEPEHVRFLRSLQILRNWPIEVLPVDNPQTLLFTYVRRGVLLCRDSNSSDWIYVVKSGHCSVIKALRAVTSRDCANKNVTPHHSQRSDVSPYIPLPGIRQKNSYTLQLTRQNQGRCDVTFSFIKDAEEVERERIEHMQTLDAILEQRHAMTGLTSSATNDTGAETDHFRSNFNDLDTKNDPGGNLVFVEILKLTPRDIYGLESCVFKSMNKTTSTSLVSGGAELIMINRKFFLDRTSEQLRKQIRKEIRPLPSEEDLQAQLETMVSWEAYRNVTLKKTVDSIKRKPH